MTAAAARFILCKKNSKIVQDLCKIYVFMCKIMTKIQIYTSGLCSQAGPGVTSFPAPLGPQAAEGAAASWLSPAEIRRGLLSQYWSCSYSGSLPGPSSGQPKLPSWVAPAAWPGQLLARWHGGPQCCLPVTGRQPETNLTWNWPSPTRTVHDAAQGLATSAAAAGRCRSWLWQLKLIFNFSIFIQKWISRYISLQIYCRRRRWGQRRRQSSTEILWWKTQTVTTVWVYGGLRPWRRRGHERRA